MCRLLKLFGYAEFKENSDLVKTDRDSIKPDFRDKRKSNY